MEKNNKKQQKEIQYINVNGKLIEFETYEKPYRISSKDEVLEDYYTLYYTVSDIIEKDPYLKEMYEDTTIAIINLFYITSSFGFKKFQYTSIASRVFNLKFETLADRIEFLNSLIRDELKHLLKLSTLQYTSILITQIRRLTSELKKFNNNEKIEDLESICLLNKFTSIRNVISRAVSAISEFNKELKTFTKKVRKVKHSKLKTICNNIINKFKRKVKESDKRKRH
jgi:uncharacterized pyridoxamine 5'-phosphate oxidase family protein